MTNQATAPAVLGEKPLTIGGTQYRLRRLGALEGRKIWLKLLKIMTGPLKAAAAAEKTDERLLVAAAAAVVDSIDEATFEELCEIFARQSEVRVKETGKWAELSNAAVFDHHFAQNYIEMSRWFGEHVVYNFGSFLGDMSLGNVIARLKEEGSKFQSHATSTGSSGES